MPVYENENYQDLPRKSSINERNQSQSVVLDRVALLSAILGRQLLLLMEGQEILTFSPKGILVYAL